MLQDNVTDISTTFIIQQVHGLACLSGVLCDVRFGPSQLSCLGSSVGRALCLEYRVSWVRVPPEAAHLF